jgi:hypothetical protein
MNMRNIVLALTWLLTAFFLIGAIFNWISPARVKDEYARWGYPSWFHYCTAILELITAGLLAFQASQMLGLTLGSVIMIAAVATVLRHREYKGLPPPVVVLGVLLLTASLKLVI